MQSLSAKVYSLISLLLFVAALALRQLMLLLQMNEYVGIAFYLIVGVGTLFAFLSANRLDNLPVAFELNNSYHLDLLSYIASAGFFVSFIHQCVRIYASIENGSIRTLTYFVPICFIGLFSLLSCFYFFTIAMSYSDRGYDFRELKFLHLAPMLWAISNVLTVMSEAISPLSDIDGVLKYANLAVSIVFYYLFASEIENKDGTKKATIIFAKIFSYLSVLFLLDTIMTLIVNDHSSYDDLLLSVSTFMISLFVAFFARSITNSNKGA